MGQASAEKADPLGIITTDLVVPSPSPDGGARAPRRSICTSCRSRARGVATATRWTMLRWCAFPQRARFGTPRPTLRSSFVDVGTLLPNTSLRNSSARPSDKDFLQVDSLGLKHFGVRVVQEPTDIFRIPTSTVRPALIEIDTIGGSNDRRWSTAHSVTLVQCRLSCLRTTSW